MDLPRLSVENISKFIESAPSASGLFDTLSQYETQACLTWTDPPRNEDFEVLGTFYASFFITHLLTDQMSACCSLHDVVSSK